MKKFVKCILVSKLSVLVILGLCCLPDAHATTLLCSNAPFVSEPSQPGDPDYDAHLGWISQIDLTCSTVSYDDVRHYDVKITGQGPGLYTSAGEGVMISCPTVVKQSLGVETYTSKRGRTKKGNKDFSGPDLAAGGLVGARLGLVVSKKGNPCLITGIGGELGVSFSIAKMTINQIN